MNKIQWGDTKQKRCSRLGGAAREVYRTIDDCSMKSIREDHRVVHQL